MDGRKHVFCLQVALVYGQMNEPPGARARVALTGLTVAEYFRDQEGQDVLLFIDNIFRFTQAGSEVITDGCLTLHNVQCWQPNSCLVLFQVSALLGRIPSAVGYQPTLATDMGTMQERITTTKKGSITSVQVCICIFKSDSFTCFEYLLVGFEFILDL